MQNAVVEVMTSDGKSLTDIAYGISSISHIDFYVESSEALASGVSVTVTASAPGRKSKMFYALSSDVHALKTIMLELESAENTRLITENTLANAETIETANGDVMVTLLQGKPFYGLFVEIPLVKKNFMRLESNMLKLSTENAFSCISDRNLRVVLDAWTSFFNLCHFDVIFCQTFRRQRHW